MHHQHAARMCRAYARGLVAAALCAATLTVSAGIEQDFERAGHAHRQGDFQTSVAMWTALAEKGQVDAQYNLGLIHLHGDGVAQDYGKAMNWLRRAADQGDKHAQIELGGMYQRGDGVAVDPEQAQRWFTAHLAHHHHHAHSEQMLVWRRQARQLLWARDMREALASGPEAAAQIIADLQQRAATVTAQPHVPSAAALAASAR